MGNPPASFSPESSRYSRKYNEVILGLLLAKYSETRNYVSCPNDRGIFPTGHSSGWTRAGLKYFPCAAHFILSH